MKMEFYYLIPLFFINEVFELFEGGRARTFRWVPNVRSLQSRKEYLSEKIFIARNRNREILRKKSLDGGGLTFSMTA